MLHMKKMWIVFIGLIFFGICAKAQEAASFSISLSSDSVLLGNYLKVSFILENADGSNFQAPDFEGFSVMSGPNTSSSFSMINGQVKRSVSYTYYLEPNDVGNYFIQAGSIEVGNEIMETRPAQVIVIPNPEGIIQQEENTNDIFKNFDLNFGMPDLKQFFYKDELPNLEQVPEKQDSTVKKKRKTVKI